MITKLNHVTIWVKDQEEALKSSAPLKMETWWQFIPA